MTSPHIDREAVKQPVDDPIIEATDIYKDYDTGRLKVRALRGVNVSIQRGEVVAIMGPSGCGKTTLLNCLSGLHRKESGGNLIKTWFAHAVSNACNKILVQDTKMDKLRAGSVFRRKFPWRRDGAERSPCAQTSV